MMSKIVRTMSSFLAIFVVIYGVYVIVHGHITPGGGFQGGAVFASGVALLVVAYGAEHVHQSLREHHLAVVESSGALIFIGLAFGGLATTFFYNFLVGSPILGNIPATGVNPGDIWSGGVIPLMNVAVGLKVIGGLSAVVLTLALATNMMEVDE
jgi:multicomponent Na+:H+ antiporter subunit B